MKSKISLIVLLLLIVNISADAQQATIPAAQLDSLRATAAAAQSQASALKAALDAISLDPVPAPPPPVPDPAPVPPPTPTPTPVPTPTPSTANYFVRPSGSSGNGSSWSAAFNGFGGINWASVPCGATIWVAGGTYSGSLSPAKTGCSATSRLTIARARGDVAAVTLSAGWSASYDALVRLRGSIRFNGNWQNITISGATTSGANGWIIDQTGTTGGEGIAFDGPGGNNNRFEYIDLQGPGEINYTANGRAIDCTPSTGSVTGNTFSHMKIWDWESAIYVVSCSSPTIEYVDMYDIAPKNWQTFHPNGIITWDSPNGVVRYSKFHKGPHGLGVGEGIFFQNGGNSQDWKIYGNVFYDLDYSGLKAIEITAAVGNIKIFNNTFDNILTGTIYQQGSCGSGAEFKNNLVISAGMNTCGAASNNATVAASAFVNRAGKDYHLTADQPGVALATEYGKDMDGKARGSGSWDMGAYEH